MKTIDQKKARYSRQTRHKGKSPVFCQHMNHHKPVFYKITRRLSRVKLLSLRPIATGTRYFRHFLRRLRLIFLPVLERLLLKLKGLYRKKDEPNLSFINLTAGIFKFSWLINFLPHCGDQPGQCFGRQPVTSRWARSTFHSTTLLFSWGMDPRKDLTNFLPRTYTDWPFTFHLSLFTFHLSPLCNQQEV